MVEVVRLGIEVVKVNRFVVMSYPCDVKGLTV